LVREGRAILAGGATHDSWRLEFRPVVLRAAEGPFTWDVSGRRLVDYWMGHGALLCGHAFKPVVEAVRTQLTRATHLAGMSEIQFEWAREICNLLPSVEQVRFTSSGTEATLLGLRVARSVTGRASVLRIDGHFHGWHDEAFSNAVDHTLSGVNPGTARYVAVARDVPAAIRWLRRRPFAAVILEPGGGASGTLPWSADLLRALRAAALATGALLIFDEVISGFRYSPGGVQSLAGVQPDLTALAKIVSGGLPGGALAGSALAMSVFDLDPRAPRSARVVHTGTFNGNPLSAAAGVAMLRAVTDGEHQQQASEAANELVVSVNQLADQYEVDVRLFAQSSIIHVMIGAVAAGLPVGPSTDSMRLYLRSPHLYLRLQQQLMAEGVDMHPMHGWLSSSHGDMAIDLTLKAFRAAFAHLRHEADFHLRGIA